LSGKSEILENPFVATGFNKSNNVLTGSISATRTAPGETDECRILFSGNAKNQKTINVRYFEKDAAENTEKISRINKATVAQDGPHWKLNLDKNSLDGECEWLLSYIGEPSIQQQDKQLSISIPKRIAGDWVGVYAIKSTRAHFYKAPAETQIQKAFLVAGDTIYVYGEKSDWYYVKFQGRKEQTAGWIKKSDTVQF
jgi:hypothetical protein